MYARRNFLCLAGVLAFCAQVSSALEHSFSDEIPPRELAGILVAAMTDREALGQALMFGFRGSGPDSDTIEWIAEAGLGGVKIFGGNTNDLAALARTVGVYQKTALESGRFGIPLLIATDQEGGWVRHVRGATSRSPGNMALGAGQIPYDAWMTGIFLGRELADLGINMNFAPAVDLFINPRADVIGPRSFGSDPSQAGILGLAFARGLEESGVIATAKHFPGHGAAAGDSHGMLPEIDADLATLKKRDLLPYRIMIAGSVPAIMVGHLAFPIVTGDVRPATLSPYFLVRLLRDEMKFDGVVVTDDMIMSGVRLNNAPISELCYQALKAGADIVLVSNGPDNHRAIYRRLIRAMSLEPGFAQRVREAARRVVALKATYLKGQSAVTFDPRMEDARLPAEGARKFFEAQAARSVTLIRDGRFPLPAGEAGRTLIVGTYPEFLREGLKRYPGAGVLNLQNSDRSQGVGAKSTPSTESGSFQSAEQSIQVKKRRLAAAAKHYDTVIFLVSDEESSQILQGFESMSSQIVAIFTLSPSHGKSLDWVKTVIEIYGTDSSSMEAAFAALSGDFIPRGRLPAVLQSDP